MVKIRGLFRFFLTTLPMSIGLILILTALTFLVDFSFGYDVEENFIAFVFFAIFGLPILLYGIRMLSSDTVV